MKTCQWKRTLKKCTIFFACNRNPPFPRISCFRNLHCFSSNNSENTNHRQLPLTGTDHCNSRLLKIFFFRETITHFRTIIFLKVQGSNFQVQFWMDCVFPLMPISSSCKNSSCVWTTIQAGWLSPILFYTRKQSDEYWLTAKLKWGRTNMCQKL